jgi:hypothetical protein
VISANLDKRQLDYEWVLTAGVDEEDNGSVEQRVKKTIAKGKSKSVPKKRAKK